MAADPTYNPKVSIFNKLGNPKCQLQCLTIKEHKTYLSKRLLNVESVQISINPTH